MSFETELYNLVAKDGDESEGYVEAFIAKGDAALVFEDLNPETDQTDLANALVDLMAEYGVSPPRGVGQRFWHAWPNEVAFLRDFTIGELKQVQINKQWPTDAAPIKQFTLMEKIIPFPIALLFAALVLVLSPILLMWLLFKWAHRKFASESILRWF